MRKWFFQVLLYLIVGIGFGQAFDLEITRPQIESLWVGQRYGFTITFALPERPRGSPQFSLPDVPGAFLIKVDGPPVLGTRTFNGQSLKTWSYSFIFFAQRAGNFSIPPIDVHVKLPQGAGQYVLHTVSTKPFNLAAKAPKGFGTTPFFLTATSFEVRETWEPDTLELKQGDALTRTLHLQGTDILGLSIPPVIFSTSGEFRIYAKDAIVQDETYRGQLSAERVETAIYVFEKTGDYVLPSMEFHWFNPTGNSLKKISLPKRTIRVAPKEDMLSGHSTSHVPRKRTSGLISFFFVIFAIFSLVSSYIFRKRIAHKYLQVKKTYSNSEPNKFNNLIRAIKRGQLERIFEASKTWLLSRQFQPHCFGLLAFAKSTQEPQFIKTVQNLYRLLYGLEKGHESDSHEKLIDDLKEYLITYQNFSPVASSLEKGTLKPLNPVK